VIRPRFPRGTGDPQGNGLKMIDKARQFKFRRTQRGMSSWRHAWGWPLLAPLFLAHCDKYALSGSADTGGSSSLCALFDVPELPPAGHASIEESPLSDQEWRDLLLTCPGSLAPGTKLSSYLISLNVALGSYELTVKTTRGAALLRAEIDLEGSGQPVCPGTIESCAFGPQPCDDDDVDDDDLSLGGAGGGAGLDSCDDGVEFRVPVRVDPTTMPVFRLITSSGHRPSFQLERK
jgi:hypothetical protein